MSFHDFAADTLLLSEDFLLPEDHQLVEECLARDDTGVHSIQYGTREGSRYSVAIPVRDARGEVNGAVRLSIDSQITDARTEEPLEQRLAPVMVCLAAEFERRQSLPAPCREPTSSSWCRSTARSTRSASSSTCSPSARCTRIPAWRITRCCCACACRWRAARARTVPQASGASQSHALDRSLGRAHSPHVAREQPQALVARAGGVLRSTSPRSR